MQSENNELKSTLRYGNCFCCGKENPVGIKMKIEYPAEGEAGTEFTIPEYCAGWEDMTHGGFLGMFLDEIMAHAAASAGLTGVTARLEVRYIRPVKVGTVVRISGKVTGRRSRIVDTEGVIFDSEGNEAARGKGTFLKA